MNDENDKKDDDWGMTMPHRRLEKDANADDYSDPYGSPRPSANQPPADDWGATQQNFNVSNNPAANYDKTTPNVNIPQDSWQSSSQPPPPSSPSSAGDDWGMTQQNFSVSPPSREQKPDDWGATTPNINLPQGNQPSDWEMGAPPPPAGAPQSDSKPDNWSMPTPVFRISEGEKVDNLPRRGGEGAANFDQAESFGFDKTTPNFNISENAAAGTPGAAAPDANLPPPVNPTVQEAPKVEKAAGSKMIYALFGVIALLFFGIVALAGAYFLFLNKPPAAQTIETPREEPKAEPNETISTAAPVVAAPPEETILPKEIEYKGAMVLVPAGEFTMGSDSDAEESKPAHKVTLPAFYIDKTEVTNAEYKKFCDASGKSYPPDPHLEKDYFTARPNAPVVGVSFDDAKAYAAWAGKRLPTETEWEKAASWDDAAQTKRAFPWGNDFQKTNVAFGSTSISDVGKFSAGASSCGALDMAGNVLEWVDAFFQPYPNSTSNNPEFGEKNRVVRGGHFGSKSNESLKTTKRIYVAPGIASGEDDEKLVAAIIGFRCAVAADDSGVKEVLSRAQSK